MKKNLLVLFTVVVAAGMVFWFTGCRCMQGSACPAKAKGAKAACPMLHQDGQRMTVSRAFPTGNHKSSVILLEASVPAEVVVGQDFVYTIKATNLTDGPLEDVVVTEKFGDKFQLTGSEPRAGYDAAKGMAEWSLGRLIGAETKVITVSITAKEAGQFPFSAKVTYNTSLCRTVTVITSDQPPRPVTKSESTTSH